MYKNLLSQAIELRDSYYNNKSEDIFKFVKDIFHCLHKEEKDEKATADSHYPYIPADSFRFTKILEKLIKKEKLVPKDLKFIDIGSGNGDKVFLAWFLFDFWATGLEYTKHTHLVSYFLIEKFARDDWKKYEPVGRVVKEDLINAESLENQPFILSLLKERKKYYKIHLIRGDGKEFDCSNYDIIYTYRPIITSKSLEDLYNQIWKTMKIGAYWFEFQTYAQQDYLHDNIAHITGNMTKDQFEIVKKVGNNKAKIINLRSVK